MNKIILIFTFLIVKIGVGQNLVPNPSFEDSLNCPNGTSNFQAVKNWFNPTNSSPDYYNSCATNGAGVPINDWGFQWARTGNAYSGLVIYWNDSTLTNYREYIEVELFQSLEYNKTYYWSMWVSLLDSIDYASNNIGISLSTSSITNFSSQSLLNTSVYGNFSNIIGEKNEWVKIEGSVVASGGESFLIIGNFYNDNQTSINQIDSNSVGGSGSYYYIDDVYLGETPLGEVEIPNVFTPNNDGINEIFMIENAFGEVYMNIYNRWGELIFFSEGRNCYWDGRTYAGVECPEGVYYYSIMIEKNIYNGFIQVLR